MDVLIEWHILANVLQIEIKPVKVRQAKIYKCLQKNTWFQRAVQQIK